MKAEEWDLIAEEYHENLISPFGKVLKNPLLEYIKKIKNKKNKVIADIGTGIGNLIPYLKDFKKVIAIDFSEEMLNIAKEKHPKTIFLKKDIRDLKGFYRKFNIIFSINSILMPSIKDIDKTLSEIKKALCKEGIFVAVFPAIESLLYQTMIVHERSLEINKNEKDALKRTKKIIGEHDFLQGIIDDSGKQKHYYKFEIEYRLKKAGFKNIKIKTIEYPWSECGDERPKKMKQKAKIWDWFVTAKK